MWIFGSERKDSPHSGSRQTGRARPFVRIKGRGKINLLQIFIHLPSVSRIWQLLSRIHHLSPKCTWRLMRPGINNHPSVTHHTGSLRAEQSQPGFSKQWQGEPGVGERRGGQWVTDWLPHCLVTNGVLTAASPLSPLPSEVSPQPRWGPGVRVTPRGPHQLASL